MQVGARLVETPASEEPCKDDDQCRDKCDCDQDRSEMEGCADSKGAEVGPLKTLGPLLEMLRGWLDAAARAPLEHAFRQVATAVAAIDVCSHEGFSGIGSAA
jgi:hypothetical protein